MTVALAIATKDQAYSLYLLPGLYLLVQCVRGRRDAATPRQLALATASAVLVLALAQNVAFNLEGFRAHLRDILGPASTDYRVFDAGMSGQVQLLRATGLQVVHCLSWSGIVAVMAGVAVSIRASKLLPFWLWLTPLSTYVTFMAVVGYSYDRFLLPVTIVCAVPAAMGIGALLDRPSRFPGARICGAILLAWIVLRPVGVDVLMVSDSRYAAEAWLHRHVPQGASVGTFGPSTALPRLAGLTERAIRPGIADTVNANPDFIVINMEYLRRFAIDPVRMEWLAWLQSGSGPYREVFRYKAPVPWYSPLRLDDRFTDRVEDPFTNLDKINPEIAIFQRQ